MKVIFFSYDAPNHISGVDSWLKRLLPELVLLNIEPSIVFITRGDKTALKKVNFFESHKIKTCCIPIEKFYYAQDRTKEVLRIINQINPHFIVPGYIMSAFYAIKWARKKDVRSIGILHSDDLFYKAITENFTPKSPWQLDACVGVSSYLYNNLVQITN